MNLNDLRRRLDVISATISGPFAAKLAKLSDAELKTYHAWRSASDRFISQFKDPSHAYAALVNGDHGPQLRKDIRERLFGPEPVITAETTLEQLAEIYARMSRGE